MTYRRLTIHIRIDNYANEWEEWSGKSLESRLGWAPLPVPATG